MLNVTNIKKITNEALKGKGIFSTFSIVRNNKEQLANNTYNVNSACIFTFPSLIEGKNNGKYIDFLRNKNILNEKYEIDKLYKGDKTSIDKILNDNININNKDILLNTHLKLNYKNIIDKKEETYIILKNKKTDKMYICKEKYYNCFQNCIFYKAINKNVIIVHNDFNELQGILHCLEEIDDIKIREYINSLL